MFYEDLQTFVHIHRNTIAYLDSHPEKKADVDDDYWALRAAADLVPQPLHKILSGHFFPMAQAVDMLGQSVTLANLGFYQYAIFGLRWVLELGSLSVYWDREDAAEIEIKPWLSSKAATPFKRDILKGLREIDHIRSYAEQTTFFADFEEIYSELSNYAHVRGARYSSHHLLRGNVPAFQPAAYGIWDGLRRRVVKTVAIMHLLKYPVGTQETPLFRKFGLNPPAGGLIEPEQQDILRSLLSEAEWSLIKELGDADPDAQSVGEWVRTMPDLSDEDLQEQSREFDRELIESQGFASWYRLQMGMRSQDATAQFETSAWVDELRMWAAAEGLLEHGRHGPMPPRRHVESPSSDKGASSA